MLIISEVCQISNTWKAGPGGLNRQAAGLPELFTWKATLAGRVSRPCVIVRSHRPSPRNRGSGACASNDPSTIIRQRRCHRKWCREKAMHQIAYTATITTGSAATLAFSHFISSFGFQTLVVVEGVPQKPFSGARYASRFIRRLLSRAAVGGLSFLHRVNHN